MIGPSSPLFSSLTCSDFLRLHLYLTKSSVCGGTTLGLCILHAMWGTKPSQPPHCLYFLKLLHGPLWLHCKNCIMNVATCKFRIRVNRNSLRVQKQQRGWWWRLCPLLSECCDWKTRESVCIWEAQNSHYICDTKVLVLLPNKYEDLQCVGGA